MSKNNPAASAAMQLGSIFTALVGSMPFETLVSPPQRNGYSQADINAVVHEANSRIKLLNNRVRKLKREGAEAVKALNDTVLTQTEYIIELETENRLLREMVAEMESQRLPRPSARFGVEIDGEAVATAPVFRR